jgi:hypothetical protein
MNEAFFVLGRSMTEDQPTCVGCHAIRSEQTLTRCFPHGVLLEVCRGAGKAAVVRKKRSVAMQPPS